METFYPELRANGIASGIDVTIVDLGWSAQHTTPQQEAAGFGFEEGLGMSEIHKCHRESCGLFFVSLLADK